MKSEESLKEKTAKGLFWGAMNNGVQQLLGFAFGIVVAMITVFSAIANTLQNSGFSTALINEKEPKDSQYSAVFWFNIAMGTAIYAVLFFCAPLISRYYHEPRLLWLSRYAFLSFVFSSFGVAQAAFLYKNLRAKELAKANIVGVLVSSSVAVLMAWKGFTYWAIATQTNLFILISTLMRWHYSEWRPTMFWRGDIEFHFIRRTFPFSVKIMLTGILTQVNNNVMNILLGRYFGSHDTGQYNQAYQWNFKGYSFVQNMLMQVDQAVLVSLNDDHERQLTVLRKMVRFAAFISFPLMFGVGLVAQEFIVLALGEVWRTSASYLQIICVAGAVLPVSTLLSDLIVSRGRSDIFLCSTLALGISQIVALLMVHPYGIRYMIIGYVCLTVAWLFVWHFFVCRLTGYKLSMLVKDTLPFALAALAVMAATHFATHGISDMIVSLIARIAMAATLYYIIMKLAGAQILDDCMKFITQKLRKR